MVDRDGREVANLPADITSSVPGDTGLSCDRGTGGGCVFALCCHNGKCKQVSACVTTAG